MPCIEVISCGVEGKVDNMRNLIIACTLTVSMLLLTGCPGGSPFGGCPEPTKKKVKPEDVIGKWRFKTSDGKTMVNLTFRPDGTFIQAKKNSNGSEVTWKGTWSLSSPNVSVEGYVSVKSGEHYDMSWYMTDDTDGEGLVLFGGDYYDPDYWTWMERVSK